MSKKARLFLVIFVLLILLVLIITAAFVAYRYLMYREQDGDILAKPMLEVSIHNPSPNSRFDFGEKILIEASASGYEPIIAIELWINGSLEGVQSVPSGGITPFTADFIWSPPEAGTYMVIARAIDSHGVNAVSNGILLMLKPVEFEESESDSQTEPIVLPQKPIDQSQPIPPSAEETVDTAQPWQASPAGWLNSLTVQSLPAEPELAAEVKDCTVALWINDQSDNEDSFVIYRQSFAAQSWTKLDIINAHSGDGWLVYLDDSITGGVNYYVSAINSQGETTSNIVAANIDSTSCLPHIQGPPLIVLDLVKLDFGENVNEGYCYSSMDGSKWSRWPAEGFVKPEEDNNVSGKFEKIVLAQVGLKNNYDLLLDCWGWKGNELTYLGNSHISGIAPQLPGNYPSVQGGLLAEVEISIDKPWTPYGIHITETTPPEPDVFIPPTAAQMPFISAWITRNPNFCADHLETGLSNIFKLLACQPYPGYNIGPNGANPQAYLVWAHLNNTCQAGYEGDCLPYEWWIEYANDMGADIYHVVTDETAGMKTMYTVNEPERSMWVINPPNQYCTDKRIFTVHTVIQGDYIQTLYSPKSGWFSMDCQKPLENKVEIDVEFKTVHLSNVDDNDYGAEDVEVYGRFSVSNTPVSLWVGTWGKTPDYCASEDFEPFSSGYTYNYLGGCPECLSDGSWPIESFLICQGNNKNICEANVIPGTYGHFKNHLIVSAYEGSKFKLTANLIDYDSSSGDDWVCMADGWTDAKSLLEWAGTTNEVITLKSPSFSSASCKVDVVLNAIRQ